MAIFILPAMFRSTNNEATIGSVETETDSVTVNTSESKSYEDDKIEGDVIEDNEIEGDEIKDNYIEIDTSTEPYALHWQLLYGDKEDLSLLEFKEGLARAEKGHGKFGFMDKNSNIVIPYIYDFANSFSDGLAHVERYSGQVEYIDKSGKSVIEFARRSPIDRFGDFHEGFASIYFASNRDAGESIIINKSGKIVTKGKYRSTGNFYDGLAYVRRDEMEGFINKDGEEVIVFENSFYDGDNTLYFYHYYDGGFGHFSEGLASVSKNGKLGFIDKTGKEVIPLKYDTHNDSEFHEGMARVSLYENGTIYGFVNKDGIEVVPFIYNEAGDFHEGLARVKKGSLWGFIDKRGNEVIPLKYNDVHDFSGGFAAVKKDGKWGFVDKSGQELVSLKYHTVRDFKEGFAYVSNGTYECGYIDKKGNEVMDLDYYELSTDFSNGVAIVYKLDPNVSRGGRKRFIVKVSGGVSRDNESNTVYFNQ